jgi:hypothetical protein
MRNLIVTEIRHGFSSLTTPNPSLASTQGKFSGLLIGKVVFWSGCRRNLPEKWRSYLSINGLSFLDRLDAGVPASSLTNEAIGSGMALFILSEG